MLYIICLAVAVFVFCLDMLSKYLCASSNIDKVVIPHLLKFKYTTNEGAAFSFLSDYDWAITFFSIMTILVSLGIIALMVYAIIKKKNISKWLAIALSLIFGGAIGNLVDRLVFGYVRDFIFMFYNTNIRYFYRPFHCKVNFEFL
jgi:signal peptidase II